MSEAPFRVLVIGYGEMGHAMEHLLAGNHELSFWDCRPIQGLRPIHLERAAGQSDFVFFCIPANPHMAMARRLAPMLDPGCICLSIAKGLDERGRTAADVFSEVFGTHQAYGLLYGPMISEEIRADRSGFAQMACSDVQVFDRVKTLFAHTRLYLCYTEDVIGISWAVILKNVYAILFGVADGLGLGDNMRGFLAVQAIGELDTIVQTMGGREATAYHLAGLGDLVTTATSAGSHHHELGRKLARGETGDISGEGVHTLAMVDRFSLFDRHAFPLFNLVHTLVRHPEDPGRRIQSYLDAVFAA